MMKSLTPILNFTVTTTNAVVDVVVVAVSIAAGYATIAL
jgi:hypothetical protein